MKPKQIIIFLFATILISSCVRKSTYEKALSELADCEQTESTLNLEIEGRNRVIRELKNELQNLRIQASSNLQRNSEKGRNKLKAVESSIEDIMRKISYCENRDDLDRVKNDLGSVRDDVHSFIFFNY